MFMKPSSGFEKLLGKNTVYNFLFFFMHKYVILSSKIDKATSHLLMEPDWPSILQICDLIRQDDIQYVTFNITNKHYLLSAILQTADCF